MAKIPSPVLDPAKLASMAERIRVACRPVSGADETRTEAQEALNTAAEGARGVRETIMIDLAALSAAEGWTAREITVAVANAISGANKTEKSMATFMGETKRAMHPNVRLFVPALVTLRDAAWDAEVADRQVDKNAPTPIKKAFSRKYHLLSRLFGEAENGVQFYTVAAVVAWAESCDPAHDPKKVFERLASIRKELEAFHADFPDDDVQSCIQCLTEITVDDLMAARKQRVGAPDVTATQSIQSPEVVATTPPLNPARLAAAFSTTNASEMPAAGADEVDEMAEGAVDILSDILDGHLALDRAA